MLTSRDIWNSKLTASKENGSIGIGGTLLNMRHLGGHDCPRCYNSRDYPTILGHTYYIYLMDIVILKLMSKQCCSTKALEIFDKYNEWLIANHTSQWTSINKPDKKLLGVDDWNDEEVN